MAVTLPIEVFEVFEKIVGREDSRRVVKSLETVIFDATEYKWKATKDELLDAIRREFVTRELFEERFKGMQMEMNERFKGMQMEMNERFNVVDERFKSLNFKLNIFIAIALLALTLANPTFVSLIEKIFR